MAGNTPALPWTARRGGELCGDFRASEGRAQIADGVGLGDQRQVENQMEVKAS